ncbi:MAG: ATP-grasp domain-containing protein [Chloroflexi bacterium]|nr:ATP-grasp domain-containing protein [Chloroflexota bacterium]
MFTKVLVANRGEIAVRIIRACQALGIKAVAVYSDADREALHVQVADEAYRLGPPAPADSYLSINSLLGVAARSGAQAVHPGYGFLAESPDFAEACIGSGLIFVGPTPDAIRRLGNKSMAKQLAESVNVPVLPGYCGEEQDDSSLRRQARQLGFPLLVKAAAGGGGRGMRLVGEESQLPEALSLSRREAEAAFGDGTLLIERYLAEARHVEVQVIGDSLGHLVHLGERECSLQRRYQKVLEESPSPAVDEALRRRMGEAAVRLAKAGGYANAGTVEFLLDGQGEFYFLEMNTRLQVEHPVTELVTGWDLVQLQFLVAAGRPLPFAQDQVAVRGHAVEARIYAEDPAQGYLPQTGRLLVFRPPSSPWVRNDVGVYQGAEVSSYYDPLLAKVIVYGHDRAGAVERLGWALARYDVLGVTTNLDLLRAIVADPEFRAGRTTTRSIPSRIEPLLQADAVLPAEALMAAAVGRLGHLGLLESEGHSPQGKTWDPWREGGRWRLGGLGVQFRYYWRGQTFQVNASRQPGTRRWTIEAGREVFDVEVNVAGDDRVAIQHGGQTYHLEVRVSEGAVHLLWQGKSYLLEEPQAWGHEGHAGPAESSSQGSASVVVAPLPGKVAEVRVRDDEEVSAHQTLLVLEAMKMEHLIVAPYAGVVRHLRSREGDQVAKGAPLLDLEPL